MEFRLFSPEPVYDRGPAECANCPLVLFAEEQYAQLCGQETDHDPEVEERWFERISILEQIILRLSPRSCAEIRKGR